MDNGWQLFPFGHRSDFDGLVCAVLLKELDMIDDIKFVHPKDMQDGPILISDTDITINLPSNSDFLGSNITFYLRTTSSSNCSIRLYIIVIIIIL